MTTPRLTAGVPARNFILYHTIRFLVGDPTALVEFPDAAPGKRRVLILREIEMDRARTHARADVVASPKDFAPATGLSGDRETATAQSVAECLRRAGARRVVTDRSLPFIYAHHLREAGIEVEYDPDKGVLDRRAKDAREIEWLAEAQRDTETVMERACRTIARAQARGDGVLLHEGSPLTAERMMTLIDTWLLDLGYSNENSIVACGTVGADCHDHGHGNLTTGQPVIVDIYPRNKRTLYNGDCTRTVVHGTPRDALGRMHRAVVDAKAEAIAAVKAGATGDQVHAATSRAIIAHGFAMGMPAADAPDSGARMTHGTGHGIGLEVHEPPLLDKNGPTLIAGDAVTVEPGLYSRAEGGVRVEDMIIVTENGCRNLNKLPEGLDWR